MGDTPKQPALPEPVERLLSDDEIDDAQEAAYRELVAHGYNGSMGDEQWDRASARAIERLITERMGAGEKN